MAGEMSRALASVPRSLAAIASADLPKYLTRDEVARLLVAAGRARDRLMLRAMWETGVRVSELLSLSAESVDWNAQVLRVRTLKRHDHIRSIPLRPPLLGELARHIAGAGISGDRLLFDVTRQRVHQIVVRAARDAGLPADRAHPHVLRHSFAIACVLARVPVLVLNEWLGHATLEATLIYTKIMCAESRRYLDDVDFG
jgi:integrase/recombinase XerD